MSSSALQSRFLVPEYGLCRQYTKCSGEKNQMCRIAFSQTSVPFKASRKEVDCTAYLCKEKELSYFSLLLPSSRERFLCTLFSPHLFVLKPTKLSHIPNPWQSKTIAVTPQKHKTVVLIPHCISWGHEQSVMIMPQSQRF